MNIVYLHGFASSPQSKKAQAFKPRFESEGYHYHIPDLNQPNFEQLSVHAMIAHVAEFLNDLAAPIVLIGSSLGAFIALHTVEQHPAIAANIPKMIFLAPGFDFAGNREAMIEQWQRDGQMPFFNYAVNQPVPVHYGFVEEVAQFNSFAAHNTIPTLIYHGMHDETVPYQQSEQFAESRPHVRLELLDSDHQLLDQTETIYQGMSGYIQN